MLLTIISLDHINIFEAVVVEFPPVDLAVSVGVYLLEKGFEALLHHFAIK